MKNLELLRCLNCGGNLHWGDEDVVVCPYCKSEYIKNEGFTTYSEKEEGKFQVNEIDLESPKVIINAYGKTFEFYVSSFEMESSPEIETYSLCDDYCRTYVRNTLPTIDMRLVGIREIKEKDKMGMEKAIKYKKEKRKPYRGGKSVDTHCRNNGGKTHKNRHPWECEYCLGNRTYKNKKREEKTKYEE